VVSAVKPSKIQRHPEYMPRAVPSVYFRIQFVFVILGLDPRISP